LFSLQVNRPRYRPRGKRGRADASASFLPPVSQPEGLYWFDNCYTVLARHGDLHDRAARGEPASTHRLRVPCVQGKGPGVMLRRAIVGLLWAVPAYLVGAFGGGYLIYLTSANQHDRSLEASMTGAFFLGPLAAIIGFSLGVLRTKAPSASR